MSSGFFCFQIVWPFYRTYRKKIVEQTEQQQQQKYSSSKWTVQTMFNSNKCNNMLEIDNDLNSK